MCILLAEFAFVDGSNGRSIGFYAASVLENVISSYIRFVFYLILRYRLSFCLIYGFIARSIVTSESKKLHGIENYTVPLANDFCINE